MLHAKVKIKKTAKAKMRETSTSPVCFAGLSTHVRLDRGLNQVPHFIQVGLAVKNELKKENKEKFVKALFRTVFARGLDSVEWRANQELVVWAKPNMNPALTCAYLSPVRMVTESPFAARAFIHLHFSKQVKANVALIAAQFVDYVPKGERSGRAPMRPRKYGGREWFFNMKNGHSVVNAPGLYVGDMKRILTFPDNPNLNELDPPGYRGSFSHTINPRIRAYGETFSTLILQRPARDKPAKLKYYSSFYNMTGKEMMDTGGYVTFDRVKPLIHELYADAGYTLPNRLK